MAKKDTYRFFTEFLGFKPEAFHKSSVSWFPAIEDMLPYDAALKRFAIPFQKNSEQMNQWLDVLNRDVNRIIGKDYMDDPGHFFKPYKNGEGEHFITLSQKDIRAIEQNAKGDDRSRYNLARRLNSLYRDFLNENIKTLLLDAFNLSTYKESWGPMGGLEVQEILFTDENNIQVTDRAMYFGRDGRADRAALLAFDLHNTLENALSFMNGSELLSAEQKEILESIEDNPLMPVGHEGNENKNLYRPALNMSAARKLQKAGITIDLSSVVDYHFHRGFGGPVDSISNQIFQEQDMVAKLLTRQFNLASLTDENGRIGNEKETLVRFRGESRNGGSYSGMTGRPVDRNLGKEITHEQEFQASMVFSHVKPDKFKELALELNKQFETFLNYNGVSFKSPALAMSDKDEQSLTLAYDTIDTMVRRKIVFDAQPAILHYLQDPKQRLDRLAKVCESLEDTIGHKVGGPISPEKFLAGKESKYGEKFSIDFQQEFETTREDFPEPKSIFEDDKVKIQKLLDDYSLSQDVEVRAYATRWAGGLTGHSLKLDIKAFTLEGAEDIAERFALVKAELRPLLQQAAAKCFMKCMFDNDVFGYMEEKTPEHDEWLKFIYVRPIADIESLRQKLPHKDMDQSVYESVWKNIGKSVAYLIAAEKAEDPLINRIASEHLKAMGERSQIVGGLIEQIRMQTEAPFLETIMKISSPSI